MQKYIETNDPIYKDILRKKHVDKDIIDSALEHVRSFIKAKKLIVYGGMAIDSALRLKGESIYHEDDIPDYDCISNTNVDHAYDLADILHNLQYENVKVIRAIHNSTMRVRINLIIVIDITYYPTKFFNKCKTITYNGIQYLHPDVQRLDLHKSLCFPFNNPPKEDIFHRWLKDIKRFNIIERLYPLIPSNVNYKTSFYTFKLPDKITSKDYAFHSFAAYALYYIELSKKVPLKVKKLDITFSGNSCTLELPFKANICLVSSTYIHKPEYASLLDRIPEHLVINDNVTIYLTNQIAIVDINGMQVVTIQYVLMHFLFFYNYYENDEYKLIYKNLYIDTLEMIKIAEKNNVKVFLPSITCLGNRALYVPSIDPNLPINYNPSKHNSRQVFDYNNFKLSGERIVKT